MNGVLFVSHLVIFVFSSAFCWYHAFFICVSHLKDDTQCMAEADEDYKFSPSVKKRTPFMSKIRAPSFMYLHMCNLNEGKIPQYLQIRTGENTAVSSEFSDVSSRHQRLQVSCEVCEQTDQQLDSNVQTPHIPSVAVM